MKQKNEMATSREVFTFRVEPGDRTTLEALARRLERKPSDAVRFIIRKEARALGLLPEPQALDKPAQ